MTNELSVEEAVELLKEKCMEINYQVNGTTRFSKALTMAIQALEQQPCEDAVSRESLIGMATNWGAHFVDSERAVSLVNIMSLPSVTPQPKVGEWINTGKHEINRNIYIFECSNCHKKMMIPLSEHLMYCPNCGSRMNGGDKE